MKLHAQDVLDVRFMRELRENHDNFYRALRYTLSKQFCRRRFTILYDVVEKRCDPLLSAAAALAYAKKNACEVFDVRSADLIRLSRVQASSEPIGVEYFHEYPSGRLHAAGMQAVYWC
ncbi:hypothetical protein WT83_27590 [Burkholderia territorii]|uniref:Uncharacterized protein n=1 Tax=Burkholderia territorii TaxID=1503055 RepID=A0A119VDU4_9BURK|nr:hypothetical protein WT83_27590 [Burkholderia territorii]